MTEWPLTVLALVFLLAYSWEVLARTHVSQCETTINVIWIVFIIDYVVSISLAHDRKTWFKNNLLLLISIMLPIFRPLRLLRLLAYVGSLAELDVERHAPGTTITDFGKAIWWAFVTTTTVGYGDMSPVTWQGKCIAVGLMIAGIALISVITATLASWIVDRVSDEADKRANETESETTRLSNNVAELTDAVDRLRDDIAKLRESPTVQMTGDNK